MLTICKSGVTTYVHAYKSTLILPPVVVFSFFDTLFPILWKARINVFLSEISNVKQ
jgi:hypothetical protein